MRSKRRGDTDSVRTGKVSYDDSGRVLGLALFLSPAQLAEMGIDPDETDAVDYCVKDRDLVLTEAEKEV